MSGKAKQIQTQTTNTNYKCILATDHSGTQYSMNYRLSVLLHTQNLVQSVTSALLFSTPGLVYICSSVNILWDIHRHTHTMTLAPQGRAVFSCSSALSSVVCSSFKEDEDGRVITRETEKLLGWVQMQGKRKRHVFNSSGSRWTKQGDKHILYLNQVLHDEHPEKIPQAGCNCSINLVRFK